MLSLSFVCVVLLLSLSPPPRSMLLSLSLSVVVSLQLSLLGPSLANESSAPCPAARAAGARAPGKAPQSCALPLLKGLPATASISAVPFAVATSSAARSSQRKAVMRSSSFSPSSRSPSSRKRARDRSMIFLQPHRARAALAVGGDDHGQDERSCRAEARQHLPLCHGLEERVAVQLVLMCLHQGR